MQRLLALALAVGVFAATPAVSNHSASGLVGRARTTVDDMQHTASRVRDPALRTELQGQAAELERILSRLEDTRAFPDDQRPGRPASRGLSFEEARTLVKKQYYENEKAEMIRTVARSGRFTTEQARLLADEMYYEDAEARALVDLYPAVIDKGRYILALDILYYSSHRTWVQQQLGL